MIRIENISLSIGQREILKNVSADLHAKSVNIIIGPNGAGKSCLLDSIGGINRNYSGEILWNNVPVNEIKQNKRSTIQAYLTQNIQIQFPIRVRDIISTGRFPFYDYKPNSIDEEIILEAVEMFEINHLLERNYLTLSGGEKQRVQFARIFSQAYNTEASEEKLLILDEPISHLDIHFQFEFLNKLKAFTIKHNLISILVIHELSLAFEFATQLIVLDEGRTILTGKPKDVVRDKLFDSTFKISSTLLEMEGHDFLLIKNSMNN